jgi:hypothetical protein
MAYSLLIAWAATVLYLITIVLFCSLHIGTSASLFLRHPVSDYAIGQTANLFRAYAWTGTLGALALTALVSRSSYPTFPSLV